MNKWFVASHKINELRKLEINLRNQKFDYYLPKIKIRKTKSHFIEEVLFPGYIFINTGIENISALQYTRGIKKVIKFGKNFSFMSNDEISSIKKIEEASRHNPISTNIYVGQEAIIKEGSLKGNLVKVCSLPANKRVDIFIHILGSKRSINMSLDDLLL